METEKTTLKIIQRTLALEKTPDTASHLFDDLNAHHEELENLREAINKEFNLEIEEADFQNLETIGQVVNLVKDYTNDIS